MKDLDEILDISSYVIRTYSLDDVDKLRLARELVYSIPTSVPIDRDVLTHLQRSIKAASA